MRLFEAQHAPAAGYGDCCNSLECGYNVPDQVYESVILLRALECWSHGSKRTHGDGIDEEHETQGKVELGVLCSPSKELSA